MSIKSRIQKLEAANRNERIWVIESPAEMSCRRAIKAIGINPDPRDLVINIRRFFQPGFVPVVISEPAP